MIKSTYLLIPVIALLFWSCSGSETYRGNWKATNESGAQLEITFREKDFTVTEDGKTENFQYSQHSVSIQNSVETYGIKVDGEKSFQIHFPIANDESKGAILDANGYPLYIISRTDYLVYDDVYGL